MVGLTLSREQEKSIKGRLKLIELNDFSVVNEASRFYLRSKNGKTNFFIQHLSFHRKH